MDLLTPAGLGSVFLPPLAAADAASPLIGFVMLLPLAGAVAALLTAKGFFGWMVAQDEGDEKMRHIAEAVRDGAKAYLYQQYKTISVFVVVMFLVLVGLSAGLGILPVAGPFAFLTGSFLSGLAGWFGMKTATLASARTANGCKNSLNDGLQIAFKSGAVMGLTVVGLALLDASLWLTTMKFVLPLFGLELSWGFISGTMFCSILGASSQALFARVGGGIFTKAADVGADLCGKVENALDEDDPRNPATIADNVGDNVGDVAGMGADLYESYLGSMIAALALGVAAFSGYPTLQVCAAVLPMLIAGGGIAASIFGIGFVRTKEDASQTELLESLGKGVTVSSLAVGVVAFVLVGLLLVLPSGGVPEGASILKGWQLFAVYGAVLTGLVAGVLIGKWTEYSTSDAFAPTQRIAAQSATGPATVIIAGLAEGMMSVWVPVIVVGLAIMLAFGLCTGFDFGSGAAFSLGLYGVAIAAVGMLSTLGITLATDAYGPIADNAGGNAEMSGQEPFVRERTDALDRLGNTTAATGKGFAIGSAALTAAALLATYAEQVRTVLDTMGDAVVVSEAAENADDGTTLQKLTPRLFVLPGAAEGEENTALIFADAESIAAGVDALATAAVGGSVGVGDYDELLAAGVLKPVATASIPELIRFFNVTLINPKVLVGLFVGVMLAFLFCAFTMQAVGRAAGAMVEEVRRQFRDIPGLLDGDAEPDYANCVAISTSGALKEMILPATIGIGAPIVVGVLLGVEGTMGLLAGGLSGGFALAVMMANAGGAWDNAKKYIEAGAHGGKGTDAHKACVVGDTVGDPFKDTSGPALNILIKLMSLVSVVFAGLVIRFTLFPI
ncbi:MAG: sodium-translocating pyrophosphatase [Planctomycetota bacterium]